MIKRTLLVIEHSSGKLKTANLNALSAAQKLGSITALVAGSDIGSVVAQACALKVDKVIAVQNDSLKNQLAEFVAPVIAATVKSGGFSHVVSSHSTAMKNILPRVGALLDVSPIADVVEITSDDTFKRPIYAGNAIAEVKSHDPVKIISVRSTAFPAAEATGGSAAVEKSSVTPADSPTKWLEEALAKSDRPELGSAKIIISGGRGMQNGDNFKILYQLADKLGGAGKLFLFSWCV
jgi:electron transfer flavoprotein alpha subunit